MSYEYEPPSWQKDAIPTELGWRHPQTGELLVSVPGGVKMQSGILSLGPEGMKLEFPVDEIPVLTDIVDVNVVVVDDVKETTPEVVVPVKRGRGRPKKNV